MDSSGDVITEEELLIRHRKERKELQGKIQALKKAATKGDKKKKKEVAEEIAQLEHDLHKRHDEEIGNWQMAKLKISKDEDSADNLKAESDENDEPVGRISKAQRRRDKKARKEKEREKAIAHQELENVHGQRNTETLKIKELLKTRNLMLHEIPSDGNCLYCAVDYQLPFVGKEKLGITKLRLLASQFLQTNSSDFLPFLSNQDTGDILTSEQFDDYCYKVANTSSWGGEVELRALSHVLKCPIEVIQAIGPSIVIGEEYKSPSNLILAYHRHMYGLGEHYNAVKPYEENIEENDFCQQNSVQTGF